MPISHKPKRVLHTMDVPSKNLTILSHNQGQKTKKKYTQSFQTSMNKCCRYLSESTKLNDMFLTLSKNHIKK